MPPAATVSIHFLDKGAATAGYIEKLEKLEKLPSCGRAGPSPISLQFRHHCREETFGQPELSGTAALFCQ